jgi:hypothetical protein
VFNALPVFLIIESWGPITVVALNADPFIVNLSPDRKGPSIVWIILMFAARAVARFTLDSPEFRGDLFGHKTLRLPISCCVTFQTIWIILHPPQPSKGVGMRVFFPFLEVFKMTKSAFSIPDIVRHVFSKNRARIKLAETHDKTKETYLNDQSGEQPEGQHWLLHLGVWGLALFLTAIGLVRRLIGL